MSRLHSLLQVEEKLCEAQYFVCRLSRLDSEEFKYELNAYLSAARSVTWLLKKEMNDVAGFKDWYEQREILMKNDLAMKFFKNLRNFSQKEGYVSVVGTEGRDSGGKLLRHYRFAGSKWKVPPSLLQRNVDACCLEHLSKLAKTILEFAEAFPFHSCPRRALTAEGLEKLKLRLSDIETVFGLPAGSTEVAGIPETELFRILQKQVDGVDFEAIEGIAEYVPPSMANPSTPSEQLSDHLARNMVKLLENR